VSILGAYSGFMMLLSLALLILELVAFVDAAIRPAPAYVAADKQTKQFWLVLIGVFTFITFSFGIFGLFGIGLVGVVAASVYILDVRPALKAIGGGRGNSDRHMGPYGPW
jgi:Protein of unknown function (DUF2516)